MRILAALSLVLLSVPVRAGDRIPGEHWQRYADPTEAGFDPARLEAAHAVWRSLPSAAFLVVSDGAVLAAWGDVERRFMCHSVRKSFMAALYGVAFDRGEIELNETLADLGIDDEPDPLLESETRARVIDLLQARSGVFHPAAYAGRTDSRPRGSEGPGRYFAYNNWDFNTLATIYEQKTGTGVFEAFDRDFGRPLGMEDWRVSDGYYHLEADKSRYPAYPFRLSARDAARFGLLHARRGLWGDQRILSRQWVDMCGFPFSIDSEQYGYGLLWWVLREPRFARYGGMTALGVGNQAIAVFPDLDLVIVNRANTYEGQGTPTEPLLDLMEQVILARTGGARPDARLVPLEATPRDPRLVEVPAERLAGLAGAWRQPPAPLGGAERGRLELTVEGGHLRSHDFRGEVYALYLQDDGTLLREDSLDVLYPVLDAAGAFAGLTDADGLMVATVARAAADDLDRAEACAALLRAHAPERCPDRGARDLPRP